MLEHSFLHLDGVGRKTEESWWDEGIATWDELEHSGLANRRQLPSLRESHWRLSQRDAVWFEQRLKRPSETWRLYADFLDDAAFLDIETTGLTRGYHHTTVAGILDKTGYYAFVRGDNLDDLLCRLDNYKLIVTYNGRQFDLPFLSAEFGDLPTGFAHIDLRWVIHGLRRRQTRDRRKFPEQLQRVFDCLGQPGGLKQLERSVGIGRRGALASLDGRHAPWLWDMAKEGNEGALNTLIRYNAEDVASLPILADLAVLLLSAFTPVDVGPGRRFRQFDCSVIPYDYAAIKEVVELEPL